MNDRLHDTSPESRRAARRGVNLPCEIIASGWDRPINSQCTDVSPYGMWVQTTYPVVEGDSLVVCFVPPRRGRELTVFARVCRVAPPNSEGEFGVGLEYESLDWFEQKTLADCLRGIPPRLPRPRLHSGVQPVA